MALTNPKSNLIFKIIKLSKITSVVIVEKIVDFVILLLNEKILIK